MYKNEHYTAVRLVPFKDGKIIEECFGTTLQHAREVLLTATSKTLSLKPVFLLAGHFVI
jgi:hypothetical protein